jgi:hypothetical protein
MYFFYGENITFDACLVIAINSTNIPPIMIINRIYENQILVALSVGASGGGLRTNPHHGMISLFRCFGLLKVAIRFVISVCLSLCTHHSRFARRFLIKYVNKFSFR